MSLLDELKRRQVLRTAAAYIAVAWLLIQVVGTTLPAFGFGDGAVRLVIVVAALGFIPVVIASWVFQLTPDGLQRDSGITAPASTAGRRIDKVIIVVLAVGITFFAFDKFVLDPQRDVELAAQARKLASGETREEILAAVEAAGYSLSH